MTVLFLCFGVLQSIVFGNAVIVKGMVPAVFTPFFENGEVNYDVIPAYAQYLQKNNISGALVAGTAGEGTNLNVAERKNLLNAWMKAATPLGLKVVMQIGGLPLPDLLELTRYCEKARPHALLSLPEMYYRPTDVSALVQYMKLIAEAAPSLPVMYYDHPAHSNVNLNMAKFFPLATKTIPNFKGIKCDFAVVTEIASVFDIRPDQRMFMTTHKNIADGSLMGYTSTMTAVSNVFPKMVLDIERAMADLDIAKARSLQLELNRRVAQLTEGGAYVPIMKASTELVAGIKLGNTRQPIQPKISPEQRVVLQEKLRKMSMLNLTNCTADSTNTPCRT